MIIKRIVELTVPSSDDGKNFTRDDRLNLIVEALLDSKYRRLGASPLANIYRHIEFKSDEPTILVSCHIDSVYGNKDYFAKLNDNDIIGTLDNSACNAILVEAMVKDLLPAQVLVSFTGDEEEDSKGADQTMEILRKKNIFSHLEIVISLDLTEEGYGSSHYTIENYFVEKNNDRSLLAFDGKRDLKKYLKTIIDTPVFIKNAEPDESWQYDEYDLNCFSLCLPCKALGSEGMHDRKGVSIILESLEEFMGALRQMTQKPDLYLKRLKS